MMMLLNLLCRWMNRLNKRLNLRLNLWWNLWWELRNSSQCWNCRDCRNHNLRSRILSLSNTSGNRYILYWRNMRRGVGHYNWLRSWSFTHILWIHYQRLIDIFIFNSPIKIIQLLWTHSSFKYWSYVKWETIFKPREIREFRKLIC